MTTQWTPSDLSKAKVPLGSDTIEFQDSKGNWHDFQIQITPEKVVFGGYCNVGFIESGYILRDAIESLDDTLSELFVDLETYYNNGPQYVSRIVCNERM